EKDNLAGIRLRLSAFHTLPAGVLTMSITSADAQRVFRQVVVNVQSITENTWTQLSFKPLQHSKGQILRITLVADLREGRLALCQPVISSAGWKYRNSRAQRVLRRTLRRPLAQPRLGLYPYYKNMDNSE